MRDRSATVLAFSASHITGPRRVPAGTFGGSDKWMRSWGRRRQIGAIKTAIGGLVGLLMPAMPHRAISTHPGLTKGAQVGRIPGDEKGSELIVVSWVGK